MEDTVKYWNKVEMTLERSKIGKVHTHLQVTYYNRKKSLCGYPGG